ncbi:hypothetical protein LJB78_00635 [Bacteroidales bacterium OttesenSCG-928-J16]|nr:hypothetical protein [Bacteroidales bacterium OttesenSCG-928-J16]
MAGVVTMGIGTVFSEIAVGISTFGGKMLMEGARAATHGYMGIVTSGGENLGRAFLTAAASSLMASGVGALNINNPLAQTAISSLTGGVTSVIGGGSFIEGAARGLVVGLLNHAMHGGDDKPNWEKMSPEEKVAAILNLLSEARKNGESSVNFRRSFSNMPILTSDENHTVEILINGEKTLVNFSLAIVEDMTINSYGQPRNNLIKYGEQGVLRDGHLLKGDWQQYQYFKYLDGAAKFNQPILFINIPYDTKFLYDKYINR